MNQSKMKVARIYLRVSSKTQDITRQTSLIDKTGEQGFYIAGVYREVASGTTADRPELQRLISDLQPGDYVVAENMDRISRLRYEDALVLVNQIKGKQAKLLVPGLIDLSDVESHSENQLASIVIDATQDLLLKIALYNARNEYELRRTRQAEGIAIARSQGRVAGKRPNTKLHKSIEELSTTHSISETANTLGCSKATVKRVRAKLKK